jgi:hypothetical protein
MELLQKNTIANLQKTLTNILPQDYLDSVKELLNDVVELSVMNTFYQYGVKSYNHLKV